MKPVKLRGLVGAAACVFALGCAEEQVPVVDALTVERAVEIGADAEPPTSVYGEVENILAAHAITMESGNPWVIDEELLVLVINGDALALEEGEPVVAVGELARHERGELEERYDVELVDTAEYRMDGELILAASEVRRLDQ